MNVFYLYQICTYILPPYTLFKYVLKMENKTSVLYRASAGGVRNAFVSSFNYTQSLFYLFISDICLKFPMVFLEDIYKVKT